MTLDTNATVAGFVVDSGASLTLSPTQTVTLTSSGNGIVYGMLVAVPRSAAIIHTLKFSGIRESAFVGGGDFSSAHPPPATDVGLWVLDSGKLDLEGTAKTAWCRCSSDPSWSSRDELILTPTGPADSTGFSKFVQGSPIPRAFPDVPPAEVLNLTRNVRIEGQDDTHRTHVWMHSSTPQLIRYVALRFVGPRTPRGPVKGRYGLHFHMMGPASVGTLVEGVVIRDAGNHAFVPHSSDGITFKNTIAYNVTESAYWWDPNDITNGVTWDGAVAALVKDGEQPNTLTGFRLGFGSNNLLKNCVAVGVQGRGTASGIFWPAASPDAHIHLSSAWTTVGCVSHNNKVMGDYEWQTTGSKSKKFNLMESFTYYNNGVVDLDHDGYTDHDQIVNTISHGPARIRSSAQPGFLWRNVHVYGPTSIEKHVLPGSSTPGLIIDSRLDGGVVVDELANGGSEPSSYDFVHDLRKGADLGPSDFTIKSMAPSSVIRVQNRSCQAWRYAAATGWVAIQPFYPC